jgi:hypothetical protein
MELCCLQEGTGITILSEIWQAQKDIWHVSAQMLNLDLKTYYDMVVEERLFSRGINERGREKQRVMKGGCDGNTLGVHLKIA